MCRVRNSSRVPDQQVTEAVISRMSQLIEPPDSSMWKWELNNLTYSNKPMKDEYGNPQCLNLKFSPNIFFSLIQLIRNGLHHPVKPLEIADSQMAVSS